GGIHPGEIDGKDAGMMLLRDLTVRGTKRSLLDRANFLFVPILGVDGHERFGPHHRSNQRGPEEQGWRTTARNLNLNRDYAKLDAPEMRAAVRALVAWEPDLYYDIHVTDGADYQYDVTWGHNGTHSHSPASAVWIDAVLTPACARALSDAGHAPGPLVFPVDDRDLGKGNTAPTFGARYSHGYGDLRHLPTLLVENHSLKSHERRVLGTYVLLEATLRTLGERGGGLRDAVAKDRARRPATVPLAWKRRDGDPPRVLFLGVESRLVLSPIGGGLRVEWSGKPVTMEIPLFVESEPAVTVERPRAYWIPPAWPEVIERLALHGVRMERADAARTLEVEMLRVVDPLLAPAPFEGRVPVKASSFERLRRPETFPAGSTRVPTDQPLGDLAVALLEPASPDSFFQWGFFLEILQQTEYIEPYVIEPTAERMLERDPALRAEFLRKLEDDAFARDPEARRRYFYEKTPYFDARWRLYPVGREAG
ncbi:MAG: M14 family metallopeptidase, partial [Planctomycetota bacterium]